jgi:3-dehydroquinate synthase
MNKNDDFSIAGAPVLIDQWDAFLRKFHEFSNRASSVHLICDENTYLHCLPLLSFLREVINSPIVIPAGEQYKTLDTCEHVWKALIDQKADRNSIVINLGGGVVTDLGGFCAATFMRGIDFIHIPTTLLAMCDAALGGKHGVDFEELKNYIGTISQPKFIWIYPPFLQTLPKRQLQNGMAEMIKHALIKDIVLYQFLESVPSGFIKDWVPLLQQSIQVKIDFVNDDLYEHGLRAALNFGHTFGHALESYFLLTDTPLLHGECIALGMVVETWLSHMVLGTPERVTCRNITLLLRRHIPVEVPAKIRMSELMKYLSKDKKQRAGVIRFSLIRSIGQPVIDQAVEPAMLEALLEDPEIALILPWLLR